VIPIDARRPATYARSRSQIPRALLGATDPRIATIVAPPGATASEFHTAAGGDAMRRFPLSTLVLYSLSTLLALVASSTQADLVAASQIPPGMPADSRDRGVPGPGEGPFPYVIVTGRSLRTEFLALARERTRNGIPSRVRSLESLRSEYPAAADDPERVRLFLRDAHQHWGTRWVLLGGDTDVIPPRYASLKGLLPERTIVSDWYFACLDGTWDADGDGRYGESADPATGDPGDQPDLEPELFLGRAPVSDNAEARRFVEKTLTNERRPADAFDNATLLFAHRFAIAPFSALDLAQFTERLLPRITDDPAQQVTRLYESFDNPAWVPGALQETRQAVIAALDLGHHVVVGYGVGSPDVLGVGTQEGPDPQLLTVSDVLGLTNGDRAGHVWLMTSQVSAFDRPTSLAEAFLRAPGGGAVTVIGPSDISFISEGDLFTNRFVEVVFDEGVATIGEALVRARDHLFSANMRMAYQLLGDPLLPVFRQSPVGSSSGPSGQGRAVIAGLVRPGGESAGRDIPMGLPPAIDSAAVPRGGERREETRLTLSNPVPSPALSSVRVECAIAGGGAGSVFGAVIIDLAGRVVRTLGAEVGTAAAGTVTWDLRDSAGRRVSPGVYFLRVRVDGSSRTARLVVGSGS